MTAHASTLMYSPPTPREGGPWLTGIPSIAGGETVSTFLVACTYHLLATSPSSPDSPYGRLRREIRSGFPSHSAIDAQKAQQLPYLQAVISESLRIYPPGSQGFPRLCPGQTIDDTGFPRA